MRIASSERESVYLKVLENFPAVWLSNNKDCIRCVTHDALTQKQRCFSIQERQHDERCKFENA